MEKMDFFGPTNPGLPYNIELRNAFNLKEFHRFTYLLQLAGLTVQTHLAIHCSYISFVGRFYLFRVYKNHSWKVSKPRFYGKMWV